MAISTFWAYIELLVVIGTMDTYHLKLYAITFYDTMETPEDPLKVLQPLQDLIITTNKGTVEELRRFNGQVQKGNQKQLVETTMKQIGFQKLQQLSHDEEAAFGVM
jgi:hypothetical protein